MPLFGDPQPLPDPLPKVEPFEPKLLPEAFRPWIQDIAERMQCPMDFPAVSVMVAIASVVGRKVVIRPKKHDDWRVVANLWGGVVGRPGVLKTPAIQEPLRPLWRLEYDADLTYQELVEQWKVQQVLAKEQEKVIEPENSGNAQEGSRCDVDRRNAGVCRRSSAIETAIHGQ